MFYPTEGTLAYSDMLLGFGIPHTILRLLGINMFLSFKLTLIFTHFIGSVAICYLLKEKLKCNEIWALIGTIAFSYSDTFGYTIRHTQLMAVAYVPVLLILLVGFFNNIDKHRKRNIYAFAAIAMLALMAYTSWYIFFFTALFALVFIITFAIRLILNKIHFIKSFFGIIKGIWKSVICYIICGVAVMTPFMLAYYPVLESKFGRAQMSLQSYKNLCTYIPDIADLINVRDDNFLFGGITIDLGLSRRNTSEEVITGFSLVVLVLFVILFVWVNKRNRINKDKKISSILLSTLGIAIILSILLTVKLSENGVSFWYYIHYYLPGAKSIRAVARFLFYLSCPMSIFLAVCGSRWGKDKESKPRKVATYIVLLLVFLSNINLTGVSSEWNYKEELAFLNSIPSPSEDVEVFYTSNGPTNNNSEIGDTLLIAYQQVRAYEIAEWFDLKTINGYSGNFPDGWWNIWNKYGQDYEDACRKWAEEKGIEKLYRYDIINKLCESV